MPVGACWRVVGQVKNREDICGSFPCTGGSATGLSATDAWRRAAVGDADSLRLIQSRVCRKARLRGHVDKTEFPPTSGNQRPCRDAGVGAIAPGFAMLERAERAHTLIHQRHLTP